MFNGTELIAVLEHLEREKGVSRQVLIEAIQAALESAAKKILHDKDVPVEAKIDPVTGEISVLSEGKKVKSSEFGRIAAQTAKQVIIQKIRDAERDVVYEEFEPKVNHVISGTVFRYDKGAVVVDFGKAEAILPKREQSARDVYRQGDRIRVFVTEVSKTQKGPQIIVSRNHAGLLKRLFEMEVPEVLDSIVEIKSVAREAGDRSKIAVYSKDEKVDCVGACVGMRGSRVKNIVRELQGEKIDIVRWNESIVEYVKGAMSPAECVEIRVADADQKKIEVIVEDDQLSLAIGKNGQNVRLASKLTGWNIDIRSKSTPKNAALARPVSELESVGDGLSEKLTAAGLETVKILLDKGREALAGIEGLEAQQAEAVWEEAQIVKRDAEVAARKGENSAESAAEEPSTEDSAENELVKSVKAKLMAKDADSEGGEAVAPADQENEDGEDGGERGEESTKENDSQESDKG
ncbi:MAG: transcription termination/antitermination protein NusA [Candidatus Omnitrophica bacterium]|nr:transcription termination/antitermination protein NusA [Candidatus Omnitrophota bacterium]